MKEVLFIAYYFPPMGLSGVQRTLKFAKYLPKYQWKPIVLTTNNTNFYAHDETLMKEAEESEIEIARAGRRSPKKKKKNKLPSYFIQKIGRMVLQTLFIPDRFIGWKKEAIKEAEEIIKERNIEVIYTTAPPYTDFLIGRELSKKYEIPYIIDYRDTWVDNKFNYYPTPFHKRKNINLENEVVTHASKIIVISRHAKELLLQRYKILNHEDVMIIPHGFDKQDFDLHPDAKPDNLYFTITHSGMFQDDRNPKYFFKALSLFLKKVPEAKPKLRLKLVGLMRKSHLKMIKKYKLEDNVISVGNVSHSVAVRSLLESDVLWLLLNDSIRTPGKLYEYFGAGKPLLLTTPDGDMRQLAMKSKVAICTDNKDIDAIIEGIKTYYNLWKIHNLPKPDKEFIRNYDRESLTEKLAKEISYACNI